MNRLKALYKEMISYYSGDPKRIQHFIKVRSLAKLIAMLEDLEDDMIYTIEAAAYVHDIGIRVAEEKYDRCDGALQELEGPAEAEKMLKSLGFEPHVIERVCYIVGHHHTYEAIDGVDFQILVEADCLVNLYEDEVSEAGIRACRSKVFRTNAGTEILDEMYGLTS